MTEKFLSVAPLPSSSSDVIERQRRKLQFWRTWAIMFTIFFVILFFYAVAHIGR